MAEVKSIDVRNALYIFSRRVNIAVLNNWPFLYPDTLPPLAYSYQCTGEKTLLTGRLYPAQASGEGEVTGYVQMIALSQNQQFIVIISAMGGTRYINCV